MKRKIAAVAVAGALALGAGAACTPDDGAGKDGGSPGAHVKDPGGGGQAHNDPSIETDGGAEGDLKVKSVAIGDAWDIGGESLPYADVAVTNSASESRTYEYEIEVIAKDDGARLDTLYGTVDHVLPGQTVDTGDGSGQEDPMGMRVENLPAEPVTYKILYVDRY